MTIALAILKYLKAHWFEVLMYLIAAFFITSYIVRGQQIQTLKAQLHTAQELNMVLTTKTDTLKTQLTAQNHVVENLTVMSEKRKATAEAAVAAVHAEAVAMRRSAESLRRMPPPPGDPCIASSDLVGSYIRQRQQARP